MFLSPRIALGLLLAATGSSLCAATTVSVTFKTSPSGLLYSVDGVTYTSSETLTWTAGTSHKVSTASTQYSSAGTTVYTFSSWSDGGALSHNVYALPGITSYTVKFSTSYQLSLSVNSSSEGSVTPASAGFYGAGASVSIEALADSGYSFVDWTGSSDVVSTSDDDTTVTMNGPEAIEANFKKSGGHLGIQYIAIPVYVVTTAADDASGDYNNCPVGGPFGTTGLNCTLRDALAATANIGIGGDVEFSSSVFASTGAAAQNTITLQYGPLVLPQGVVVSGPVVQTGSGLSGLVTVSGGGSSTVFTLASGVTAEIDGLTIANGASTTGGGAIYNDGTLTLTNDTISNSSAAGVDGGGIYNDSAGVLTLTGSTVSGNTANVGGGIADYGTMTLTDDTLSGNTAATLGGGIDENGTAILTSDTISSNTATSGSGGGIAILGGASLTLTGSILSGNGPPPADVQGSFTDAGGNIISQGTVSLAPLGNYGGPTETQIPLPGSPAICGGLAPAVVVVGADQRGYPNVNTIYPGYSATAPCIDAGSVQTNYSLAFTGQPAPVAPATSILTGTSFTAAVTLDESGNPFSPAQTLPLTLTGSGNLSGASAATVNGAASYSALQVDTADTGDVLGATVQLNPPGAPTALDIYAASNPFSVVSLATTTAASSVSTSFSAGAQSVSLAASVTSSQTVNAGTVTFTVLNGTATVGSPVTSATVAGGTASANYILPAAATPGVYTIQAAYNAGGAFSASTDAAHTLTIAKAASAVSVTSSTANANLNASLTLTAMVTGAAAATPTGTVEFYDGSQALGSVPLNAQGVANYPASSLAAGVHLITAVYSGDADFAASTSAQYVQTVTAPGYTLTANPTSLSLAAGQTGQVVFTLAPVGGFTGSVNFACTGLPYRSVCAFSPSTITANGSNSPQTTTMTIETEGGSSGTVAANAHGQSFSGPMLARLSALPALLFGLFLLSQRKRLRRAGFWVCLALLAVTVSAFTGCGGSSPTTAAGTYTVVITAGSGSSSGPAPQSVTFTLTITQ